MSAKPQSMTLRLSTELVEDARKKGKAYTRSAAGQIEHWAKLGRALESGPVTMDHIQAALEGRLDPANLNPAAREYYYDALWNQMANVAQDNAAEIRAHIDAGGAVGYDDQGRLVRSLKGGGVEVLG